jgi:6-pyruvoyltetrahydropterin/6-carboxytetrahydropterin synthase
MPATLAHRVRPSLDDGRHPPRRAAPESSYLRNIKDIDGVVRETAIPIVTRGVHDGASPVHVLGRVAHALRDAWPGATLDQLTLALSPFVTLAARTEESPMVRLSQKFEFSASHRLFNRDLERRRELPPVRQVLQPTRHGHNYELQVTLAASPAGRRRC